jgi:ElaB/YqjD/DUF883 family membrane-anchored ribosome-binding protein
MLEEVKSLLSEITEKMARLSTEVGSKGRQEHDELRRAAQGLEQARNWLQVREDRINAQASTAE